MKRVLCLMLALLLGLCACAPGEQKVSSDVVGPEPSEGETEASESPVCCPTDILTPGNPVILGYWENTEWQEEEQECFRYDVDGDGEEERFGYRLDAINWVATIAVGEMEWELEYDYVNSMALLDMAVGDGWYDLLVCGDVASADYITVQLHVNGEEMEEATRQDGYFYLKNESIWMDEVVNALGTWMATRKYGMDEQGLLVALEQELVLNQGADAQDAERLEYYPRVRKDITVTTLDGKQTILPAGSIVYPVRYPEDCSWVELQVVGGDAVRLTLRRMEEDGMTFPDHDWENGYFENVLYAG